MRRFEVAQTDDALLLLMCSLNNWRIMQCSIRLKQFRFDFLLLLEIGVEIEVLECDKTVIFS
jgi:hypothetical protein